MNLFRRRGEDALKMRASEIRDLKRSLFDTEPYEPKHTTVKLPKPDSGFGWASGIEKEMWIYERMLGFDAWVNEHYMPDAYGEGWEGGPWRLQLRSDPYLTIPPSSMEGPEVGLRYRLHYNSYVAGEIELKPMEQFRQIVFIDGEEPDFYAIQVYVNIDNAGLIPHEHVSDLLVFCADAINHAPQQSLRVSKVVAVERALTACLWETVRRGEPSAEIEFCYEGGFSKDYDHYQKIAPHSWVYEEE